MQIVEDRGVMVPSRAIELESVIFVDNSSDSECLVVTVDRELETISKVDLSINVED